MALAVAVHVVPLDLQVRAVAQHPLDHGRDLRGGAAFELRIDAGSAPLDVPIDHERLPNADFQDWFDYRLRYAGALYSQGEEFGQNVYLQAAIEAHRTTLAQTERSDHPLDWAATQNDLGTALGTLGGRESGTVRVEEAVAAFRAALEERTRERVPLDWAMTQNNLGAALWRLGVRESGTARLEESVAASRAALEEWTRERVPLDWATTQNNLGIARWILGTRLKDKQTLQAALSSVSAAQEVFVEAGYVHYADYFKERLAAIQQDIASVEAAIEQYH
jgi:tetratricopeptide (TPR) repeat protein